MSFTADDARRAMEEGLASGRPKPHPLSPEEIAKLPRFEPPTVGHKDETIDPSVRLYHRIERKDEARRYDEGKPRFELIPPDALEELAEVYAWGAKKYSDHNWIKGMGWSRCLGSLLRHAFAWVGGEDVDKESGLHHLSHCAWNALTLVAYAKRGIGTDDRVKIKR